MNKTPYMSRNEFSDWIKLSLFAGECEHFAKTTKDPKWRKQFKCCSTWLGKIMLERIDYLDAKQCVAVNKKWKEMKSVTFEKQADGKICTKDIQAPNGKVEVNIEDLYDIIDLAQLSCLKCRQGDFCKECKWRQTFFNLGITPYRTDPKEGECEWRLDNERRSVTPEYMRAELEELGEHELEIVEEAVV